MEDTQNTPAYLEIVFERIWEKKGKFFLVFFCVFIISYGFLYAIDFIPEKPQPDTKTGGVEVVEARTAERNGTNPLGVVRANTVSPLAPVVSTNTTTKEGSEAGRTTTPTTVSGATQYPTRIEIDTLSLEVPVLNPKSRAIADLDAALLRGVVRHPDSADFKNEGTMLIFGHSSYLPVIHNQNYKAFNGLQKLTWGDTIRVYSDDTEYTYRVSKVYKALASEETLTIENDKPRLVLVTCNSFGSKDDRFVVEAELLETRAL